MPNRLPTLSPLDAESLRLIWQAYLDIATREDRGILVNEYSSPSSTLKLLRKALNKAMRDLGASWQEARTIELALFESGETPEYHWNRMRKEQ